MKINRLIILLLTLLVLFLLSSSTSVFAATVQKGANFSYAAYSPDCGIKVHGFRIEYWGDQFESTESGQTYQAVKNQDFLMYRPYGIYPVYPTEVGNGTGQFEKVELQNSSGSTVQTQTRSSWSTGTYGSYLFDSRSIVYTKRKNAMIQNFPAGSYRIKCTGTHMLPSDEWVPCGSTKSVTTSYF